MLDNNQIATILIENNFRLLGQIDISENNYKELIEFVGTKVRNLYMPTIPNADLMLSLALVQIAIRRYKDGRFWPCFEEEIGCRVPSARLNYIGKIFYKTIKQYNLFIPRLDDGDFQYVEYIKAHAFITNYYMQGFYDFSYAYYENNLFRQLNSESIEEDFEDLSSFMETTLKNQNDNIIETGSNRTAKSYKLLKSTRTTFAICDTNTICKLFLPILKLIDNYFYDNEIPQISKNRYEEAFIEWCRVQDAKNTQKNEKQTRTRKGFSHKPYISVEVDKEFSHIVIPPQKFRDEDCEGYANAIIEINGYTKNIELDVYKSFGLYITEEKHIPIHSIFDSIDITIKTLSEKNYRIPASNYRIFDRQWKYRNRFDIGYNYILVRHGVQTKWENSQDEIDNYDGYRNWNYFSAKINEESIFYVGNKPISIIGEFSIEPMAVEKARRHAENDESVLFLCYNHYLKEHLQETYGHTNISYYTIDGLACKLCDTITPNYERLKDVLEEMYLEGTFPYKHVIIDEGQDFGKERLNDISVIELLKANVVDDGKNGTFYLFYDKNQMVQAVQLPSYIGESDCKLTLYRNCRNTENIATTSLRLLGENKKPKLFDGAIVGDSPEMFFSKDVNQTVLTLNAIIEKAWAEDYTDIQIVTCKTEESSIISDECSTGVYLYKSEKIPFTTCRKYKGLEADVIIMVDLDDETFENNSEQIMYVGSSRARYKLFLINNLSKEALNETIEKHNVKTGKIIEKTFATLFNAKYKGIFSI